MPAVDCPNVNEWQAALQPTARLNPTQLAHLDHCWECREIVAELVGRGNGGSTRIENAAAQPEIAAIGRFAIDSMCGQGAMGVVYRAHDPLLQRPVAIK